MPEYGLLCHLVRGSEMSAVGWSAGNRVQVVTVSPSPTVGRYYDFGGSRALHVVKEQDAGHDPAELQTGQNTTVQAHPHFPMHNFPLNVWPFATVPTVGR
jgi:hypothetical protein